VKIKSAWYPPSMANRIVVELPDGELRHFNQTPFREVSEKELEPYRGHYPSVPFVPTSILKHYGLELMSG